MNPEIALLNKSIRPNQREQLRLADYLAGALDQSDKNIERTGAELNGHIVAGENATRRPELKLPEA